MTHPQKSSPADFLLAAMGVKGERTPSYADMHRYRSTIPAVRRETKPADKPDDAPTPFPEDFL